MAHTASNAEDLTRITVMVRDQDHSLEKFLREVERRSGTGHSFEGEMDSESDEGAYKFWFDGDGSFRIHDIQVEPPPKKKYSYDRR